jgi:hypothetical protein
MDFLEIALLHRTFPKSYLTLGWHRPSFSVKSSLAWNNEEQLWDFANIETEWTIDEDFAFAVEFRHRSKYDWRKANHTNFILDVARPIPEFTRFSCVRWTRHFTHSIFFKTFAKMDNSSAISSWMGRKNEPRYKRWKSGSFYNAHLQLAVAPFL